MAKDHIQQQMEEFKKSMSMDWEDFSLMSIPIAIIMFITSIIDFFKGERWKKHM